MDVNNMMFARLLVNLFSFFIDSDKRTVRIIGVFSGSQVKRREDLILVIGQRYEVADQLCSSSLYLLFQD